MTDIAQKVSRIGALLRVKSMHQVIMCQIFRGGKHGKPVGAADEKY